MAFPTDPQTIRVELWLNDAWVDVAAAGDVRYDQGVAITRGRADEQSQTGPSTCALTIDGRSGGYSPSNLSGAYYGQIGRNTPLRIVLPDVVDTFGRTTVAGWGTSDTGQAWTVSGGVAANYATGSGVATVSLTSVNVARNTYLSTVSRKDVTVSARFKPGVVATGDYVDMAVMARVTDVDNAYLGTCRFNTDGTVFGRVHLRQGGTNFILATTDSIAYTASTTIGVELTVVGRSLGLRIWDVATPSSAASTWSATSATFTSGTVGARLILAAANTNPLPVGVTVDDYGVDDVRFCGEVPAWPHQWDATGTDVTVPVEAAGIMRRLDRGAKPLRSTIYRNLIQYDPTGYWPLEDSSDATSAASAVSGVRSATARAVTFEADSAPPGAAGAALLATTGGLIRCATSKTPATGTGFAAMFMMKFTTIPGSATQLASWTATGTVTSWILTPGLLGFALTGLDADGATVVSDSATYAVDPTQWLAIQLETVADGANTDWALVWHAVGEEVFWGISGTYAGTPGRCRSSVVGGVANTYVTQVWIGSDELPFADATFADAANGYAGEVAGTRVARLCDEENVALVRVGDLADTSQCGPQQVSTLMDLLRQAADVDMGILYEPRQLLGLAYRTRASLYNQDPSIELDYSAAHLSGQFTPVPDDQSLRNDVDVSRIGGSSARRVLEAGPLSILAPPDGVNTYDVQAQVNAYSDDQLDNIAGWILRLGTWDEDRHPSARVELHRQVWAASASLSTSAKALDLGDLATVDNTPSFLRPGLTALMAQGQTEVVNKWTRSFEFNTTPAGPYTVGVLDSDTLGRLDTGGSALASSVTDSGTSFLVATTSGGAPWTVDAGEAPFDLHVGGERVTVTAVADTTITFVAAGVVAHANNASVSPALPAGLAAGDLLVMVAAIRSSGAGVPDTPAGYERLAVFPSSSNAQLFAKIASGSESAPTVSFTGGSAGDDTSAQLMALRGTFYDVSNTVVDARACLNASAQDVAYPQLQTLYANCVILYVGWKQDDWTSVAAVAGATEIGEPDTTTGSDQGLVWDYAVQTTATNVASGVFTVTGGATAISRGAVAAFRSDVQTFTVTRGVDGDAVDHDADTAVRLWQPLVLAL